jgi:hypothetical protein
VANNWKDGRASEELNRIFGIPHVNNWKAHIIREIPLDRDGISRKENLT